MDMSDEAGMSQYIIIPAFVLNIHLPVYLNTIKNMTDNFLKNGDFSLFFQQKQENS